MNREIKNEKLVYWKGKNIGFFAELFLWGNWKCRVIEDMGELLKCELLEGSEKRPPFIDKKSHFGIWEKPDILKMIT